MPIGRPHYHLPGSPVPLLRADCRLPRPPVPLPRARDELLPQWTRAYGRLKKIAAAAWVDDEATYGSVFAPVDAIQAPKARRAKKTAQPTKGNGTGLSPL